MTEVSFRLDGMLCVVTGAGRGNGEAIARGMARAGARVVVTDIDGVTADVVANSFRAEGHEAWSYPLDVANRTACEALAEIVASTAGPVDCVVNNAGIFCPSRIGDEDAPAALEKTLAVNVHGPFNVTRAFLPALRRTRGCVINVGSIQSFVAAAYSTAYAISKGAVAQLTRTLAAELAADGIRVNAIAPGLIETAMTERSRTDEARMQAFRAHTPMKRLGLPGELAGPVIFLASEAASYVTGVVMPVDGGYLVV